MPSSSPICWMPWAARWARLGAVGMHHPALQDIDRRQRGADAHRVAVVCAGEGHAAARPKAVHKVGTADQRGDRVAVGHGLGEGAQVGRHAGDRLVAAERMAEAGDHLVEDQHRSMLRAQLAQRREELGPGQHAADVVRDDLDQDGRDLLAARLERLGQRLDIVEGQDQRLLGDLGHHAQRERVVLADLLGRADHISSAPSRASRGRCPGT